MTGLAELLQNQSEQPPAALPRLGHKVLDLGERFVTELRQIAVFVAQTEGDSYRAKHRGRAL